ncbi:hypothetical protein C8A01DRAFT_47290 [Parachaetomium inaequale]|uniref:Uncharacterized protein n=1 Tax=Parachaetomium inaequale TaxID=2588326 RepID=A0AAN6PDZ9_9PEZI|nr:hypothetical protein C8A01DRAFT_47290 [Parachaetomium inaequale]
MSLPLPLLGEHHLNEVGAISGWNCLGDAAQCGIVLVIVAFVIVTGYLYWRLKIKPNFRGSRGDTRTPVNGYWEVTRRDPSRVSITIYREPRMLSDSEAAQTEGRAPRPRKGDNGPTPQENNIANQVTKQFGSASTSDVHLVPPPPPPPAVFWTAPAPSVIPPPPPFGPPTFLQLGPPPAPLHPNPLGFGTGVVPYPPVAPPPGSGDVPARLRTPASYIGSSSEKRKWRKNSNPSGR